MSGTFDTLKRQGGFFLIAGPCVIEGEEMAFEIGRHIKAVCDRLDIPFAFKGSRKNRGLVMSLPSPPYSRTSHRTCPAAAVVWGVRA